MDLSKITIEDLKKLDVEDGDRLVVTVDTGKMPPHRARQHIKDVRKVASSFVPKGVKVLVMPTNIQMHTVRFKQP